MFFTGNLRCKKKASFPGSDRGIQDKSPSVTKKLDSLVIPLRGTGARE